MTAAGPRLRPMHKSGGMAGGALTVKTRPGDNLMLHKAIDMAEPGDVIVVDGGGELTNSLKDTMNSVNQAMTDVVDNLIRIPLMGDIVASKPLEVGNDGFDTYDADDAIELSASLFNEDSRSLLSKTAANLGI